MKENKLIIEKDDGKEIYDILINIELNDNNYIIYTKHEENECGDTIAYAGNYEFKDGKQHVKPVEDDTILEFLDTILIQIQRKMNGSEVND